MDKTKPRCVCDLCKFCAPGKQCYSIGVDKCLKDGIYSYFELRCIETENKPLTLKGVTEKRGKPLWYQPITDGEDTPFDNEPTWFICNPDKLPEPFYLYAKTWLAYDREPVSK